MNTTGTIIKTIHNHNHKLRAFSTPTLTLTSALTVPLKV